MKLNHLGVVVSDVQATGALLETYFGLKGVGKSSASLTHVPDDAGFILSLAAGELESSHIGFIQETEAEVDALFEPLKADGFAVEPPSRNHGWTFYVRAPGGLIVEVVC